MHKFNVGDIVVGNQKNEYGITAKGVKCEVVAVGVFGVKEDIMVKTLEGNDKGYQDSVESSKFDLYVTEKKGKSFSCDLGELNVKTAKKVSAQKYTVEYDKKLNTTFIRVGDVTIAVPATTDMVSITTKHPDDVECPEIGKAMAYYRLAKSVK